ncbi:MAG: hypothetical protein ACI92G_002160 [Candidatus Pelagisphaera sp.]|jgi:hypothetical protein
MGVGKGSRMKGVVVAFLSLALGIAVLLLVRSLGDDVPVEVEQVEKVKQVETEAIPVSSRELEEIPEKRLLDFDDTPLSELVRVLNQDNATQIEFADPEIGEMKITASLRSGNPDGFVRLLEITMDLRAERVGSSKIVLHLK